MDAEDICRRAVALHRGGNLAEAEQLYRQALAADPQNFTALHLAGVLCAQQGRKSEALALLQAALAVNPDAAPALLNYGLLLEEMGRLDEAREVLQRATTLRPDLSAAFYNLGNVQRALGEQQEALTSYDLVLAREPGHAGALNNRAGALVALGRTAEALECYDRAVAAEPGQAELWRNRGNLLRAMNRPEDALASFRSAVAAEPQNAPAWDDLGAALWDMRRIGESLDAAERAIAADPDYAPAWFHKSVCLLAQGKLAEGWRLLAWRQKLGTARLKEFRQPQWTGKEKLDGKILFVWWEEGFGDAILFLRFAVLAAEKGARVIFSVPDRLRRLFSGAGPVEIIGAEAVPPDFDYHIPLLALPEALGVTLENLAPQAPWLKAEPALVESWAARLGAQGFRIGIIWAATTSRSMGRSFPLRALKGIANIRGVRLISLQKHDGLEQIDTLPPGMKIEILPAFDAGSDAFVDTAAIMENVDLVISADTAAAHLAGALGRPVWLALQLAADWRWFLDRTDSPWYPSMRLFRQKTAGDWAGVFAQMEAMLASKRGNAISRP